MLDALHMAEAKWFVHLSDIHFRKIKGLAYDPYDLDEDLRDQLELDLRRVRATVGHAFHGIIVSGDVTFAGGEDEFEVATKWLRGIADIIGSPHESVFCVPGNHDAVRKVADDSVLLKQLHASLRAQPDSSHDERLAELFRDTEAGALLLRPFEQYNRFAAKYGCMTKREQLFWENRVPLNDGSTLVLRGANSALVSNWKDDNKAQKLVLGTLQATARERDNEVVLFVCHHPLDWLFDYDEVARILNARARVQLFGHKHAQVVEEINNCVRIVAGAVHPDRREPKWRPRYNCIGFRVSGPSTHRQLAFTLFPRVWSETAPRYDADYEACGGPDNKTYWLKLQSWAPPRPAATILTKDVPPEATPIGGGGSMDSARTLTYRFLSLAHLVRLEIAQALRLMREEDEGISDAELWERILSRATEESRLAELWDLVESKYEDKLPNPYKGS
jgi:predicted phosphodiesterase